MIKDNRYFSYRDVKCVDVPPIDELCLILKDKFMRQLEDNEHLKQENKRLKDEHYKAEEMEKMKAELKYAKDDLYRGFPISEKEMEAINNWKKSHKCFLRNSKRGGYLTYKFFPTELGTSGTCTCGCGEEFEFQQIG